MAAFLTMVAGASASTEEAWQEFRAATERDCRAALPEGTEARIAVNAFGTASHGAALMQVEGDLILCVTDKQGGAVELSPPFPPGLGLVWPDETE